MADSDAGGLIELRRAFLRGLVIPAHPLALTADRQLDERRQVALTRYYCDAGAGGIAVAVHTTQFEIRQPRSACSGRSSSWRSGRCGTGVARGNRPISVAGVVGRPRRPCAKPSSPRRSATTPRCSALPRCATPTTRRSSSIAARRRHHPGRRLLPPAGGRRPSARSPFLARLPRHRPRRRDQSRAVRSLSHAGRHRRLAESGRDDVALYTGNDDAIVADLLTPFPSANGRAPMQFRGGLLGQWAVGTRRAVALLIAATPSSVTSSIRAMRSETCACSRSAPS